MIKLVIIDVDGVLTDGTKAYDKEGKGQLKNMCDKDWTTIKRFKAIGIPVVSITGDPFNEAILTRRNVKTYVNRNPTEDGGISHVCKSTYLPELCEEYNCKTEEIVYIGDDIFDIGIMRKVGYSFCPLDAPSMVKDHVWHVLSQKGGHNVLVDMFEILEKSELISSVPYSELIDLLYEIDEKDRFNSWYETKITNVV
jgi:YrbI family 3-deoxy-D-manno-octulosonate 8-phosphate phosphatase